MNGIIIQPLKLYLDTSHLINMARVRKGQLSSQLMPQIIEAYRQLDALIQKFHIGVIYNAAAPLDWVDGRATEESIREIAGVVESARLRYYFENDQFAYLSEILAECKRVRPSLKIPDLPILQQFFSNKPIRLLLIHLINTVPNFHPPEDMLGDLSIVPEELILPGIEELAVETMGFRRRHPDRYQERVNGFRAALLADIAGMESFRTDRLRLIFDWIKRFLRADRVLAALNAELDVDSVLKEVDTTKCPAVHLYFETRYQRARADHAPQDNDVDDWASIPLAIYADVMLTERQLRSFIVQADRQLHDRVVSDPSQACIALRKLIGNGA